MSESDNISQLLNQALQILQENDPYAAEYILSQIPASAHSNQFYLYILVQILRVSGREQEARTNLEQLANLPQLSDDVVLNTLNIAIELHHISEAFIQLSRRVLKNDKLEAAASRYLLIAGDHDHLLQAQKKFSSEQARFNAMQSAVSKGKIDLALKIAERLSAAFKRQQGIACILLSIERLADFSTPPANPGAPQKLVVITPLGPGHENILEACQQSVEHMARPEGWEVQHLVIDDTAGQIGRSKARNQGVQQACADGADWIFFLDADDLMAEQALLAALPYLDHYDAVWGLIASFQDNEAPVMRADQLPFIDDKLLLLSSSPFQTLQMGLFVKAEQAAAMPFDENMNSGEDFKFYYSLWDQCACLKVPLNFFYNRRGLHSTGPRSASGNSWDIATSRLHEEQISSLELNADIRGHAIPQSALLRHNALYYLNNDFRQQPVSGSYRYIFSPSASISALEYTDASTVWLNNDSLVNTTVNPDDTLLLDLRRVAQRFFDIRIMHALSAFARIDVLTTSADDLKLFKCNLPLHKMTSSEVDPASQAIITRLDKQALQAPRFIFIAGYSRSGSTMAYNMLSTSVSNYQFFDEEKPVYNIMHRESGPCISKRPLDIFDLKRISRSHLAAETALMICYRDPRAMLTSKHRGVSDDYFMGYDKTYFLKPGEAASYTLPGIIDTQQSIYNAACANKLHSVVPLRYEDLVLHTQLCQDFYGQVYNFDYSGNFVDFHKQELGAGLTAPLNNIRAVDASTINKWQDPAHADRLQTQFARCPALYDVMKFYGYQDNNE